MELSMKNCNSNDELCKATKCHEGLKEAHLLIDLLQSIFSQLSLNDQNIKIFGPASDADLNEYDLKQDVFDKNI